MLVSAFVRNQNYTLSAQELPERRDRYPSVWTVGSSREKLATFL